VICLIKSVRYSSSLLKHVIEGKLEGRVEVTVRQGRRCKQLLDYFKEKEDTVIYTGSIRSQCVEKSLWKRLWTVIRQTTY
jgi:hypothetical protein